jgi:uncharacterized membrane protein YoaK (UPF0700 family)
MPSRKQATDGEPVDAYDHAGSRPSVAVLLTLSGGFLDAFAWVGHGHVFANAMTGNVALLGIHAAAGEWRQAVRHIPPLAAFLAAVFAARAIRLPGPARVLRRPALACLLFEIVYLAAGAALGGTVPDAALIPGISFVAALQTSTFTHLEALTYSSVMTTGNLRRFAGDLFAATVERRDPAAARNAALFGMISTSFLAGALLGGLATGRAPHAALWVPAALLMLALLRMLWLARRGGI